MNRQTSGNLHHLIGARARYHDELYEVLEVLDEDPPSLVLQNTAHTTIQPDQHGEAHRRVPETVTVPLTMKGSGEIDFGGMNLEMIETAEEARSVVT